MPVGDGKRASPAEPQYRNGFQTILRLRIGPTWPRIHTGLPGSSLSACKPPRTRHARCVAPEFFTPSRLKASVLDLVVVPIALQVTCSLIWGPIWGILAVATYTTARSLYLASASRGLPHRVLLAFSVLRIALIVILASPRLWALQGMVQTFLTGSTVCFASLFGRTALIERAVKEISLTLPSVALRTLALFWGSFQVLLAIVNAALFAALPVSVYLSIRPLAGVSVNAALLGVLYVVHRQTPSLLPLPRADA